MSSDGSVNGVELTFWEFWRKFVLYNTTNCRSRWPRDLRRRYSAARLLRLWVRIPPGTWMFVCCDCCVLSGRGLCDGLITPPEESYRMWRVVVCYQETSKTRRLRPATGLWKYNHNGLPGKQTNKQYNKLLNDLSRCVLCMNYSGPWIYVCDNS